MKPIAGAVLAAALILPAGSACTGDFPTGSINDNVLGSLLLYGSFGLTPSTLTHVAAGATYQFRLSGGAGAVSYSIGGCSGEIGSSGLFQAPNTDEAACTVFGRDSIGASRSVTFPVRTYASIVKNHGSSVHVYFPFDGNYSDSSGNNSPSAPVAGPTFQSGGALASSVYPNNQVLVLDDASSQYVNGINTIDPAAAAAANGFSAEAWFKIQNADELAKTNSLPIVSQETCAGTNRVWIGIDADSQDQVATNLGGTMVRSGITVEPGRWYHAVVTVRGTSLNIYVNGVLRKSASVSVESCTTPGGNISIGRFAPAFYFGGSVDEVAVYSTALSATDVANHYLAGQAKTVAVDSVYPYASYGNSRTFYAIGGQAPFTYSAGTALTGDSIDAASGTYQPPSISSSSAVQATQSIRATDSHGNVGTFDVTVAAFPNAHASLSAWLTAETIKDKADGNGTAVLFDLSANSMVLSQFTTPPFYRPASVAAIGTTLDKPALEFSARDQMFSDDGFHTTGDVTAFVLAKRTVAADGVLLSFDGTIPPAPVFAVALDLEVLFQLGSAGGALRYGHRNGAAQTTGSLALAAAGNWELLGLRRTGGTTIMLYRDAASEGPNAVGLGVNSASGQYSSLRLGGAAAGNVILGTPPVWPGQVAEAVVYYRSLTDAEVQQVQCYFKLKYGLGFTIPTYCP